MSKPLQWLSMSLTMFILLLTPMVAHAESTNIFVEDHAKILTSEQKNKIKQMNEETFANLEGKPQYAVVTLPSLNGESVEDYASKKFETLGIGQRDEDNGFLFVIAIKDREYRLEVGYGVEDVITDSMKDDIVSDEATDLLKDEEYGQAVMLISKNIEKVVSERYGNYEASKQQVIQKKAQQKRLYQLIGKAVMLLLGMTGLGTLGYFMRLKRLQKKVSKQVISDQVRGNVLEKERVVLGTTQPSKRKYVSFAAYLAKEVSGSRDVIEAAKTKLPTLLMKDALMSYLQQTAKEHPYAEKVYLEDEGFYTLQANFEAKFAQFPLPLQANPYLSSPYIDGIKTYVARRTTEHHHNLVISKDNQQMTKQAATRYIEQQGLFSNNKLNNQLLVALMAYRLLENRNLADPKLLTQGFIHEESLEEAYKYAEKQRRKIDKEKRQDALNDLSNMTLGNYYLQTLMWSNYHQSSSSIGGGTSFGGGASGGGGFSGGW